MRWINWLNITDNHWMFNLALWFLLLLPLIAYKNIGYPFEFGRLLMLMFVLPLLFFGALVNRSWHASKAWWRSPLFWLGVGLLFSAWVSGYWGVNFYRSFWGVVSRSTGLLYLSSIFFLGVLLLMTVRQVGAWLKILSIMSWVGCASAAFVILQRFDINLVYKFAAGDRSGGLVGNPIFLGMFLIPTLFLAIYFWLSSVDRIRWLYLISAILQLAGIALTSSRGPFLGLLAGGVVMAIGWLWLKRPSRRGLMVGGAIVVPALLATGAILYWSPLGQRLLELGLGGQTLETRLLTWSVAWRAFLDRPWLGYGPENVGYAFNKFYQANFGNFGVGETVVDRAHNIIFDQLLATGILGTVLLLGLVLSMFILLIREAAIHRSANLKRSILNLTLLSVGVAYFVSELTAFSNLTTLFYLSILIAAVVFFTSPERDGELNMYWWKMLPLVLLLPYLILDVRYLPQSWAAGYYAILAERTSERGEDSYAEALSLYRYVQRLPRNPYQPFLLSKFPKFSRNYAIALINQNKLGEAEARIGDGLQVLSQIKPVIIDNPTLLQDEAIFYMLRSMVYPNQPIHLQTAKDKFAELIRSNPNREYLYLNWARVLMDFGLFKEAREAIDTAANLLSPPRELEFWRAMWGIMSKQKDSATIVADLKLAVSKEPYLLAGDQIIISRAVNYLIDQREWSVAKYYQNLVVGFAPRAIEERVKLATIYAQLGDFDQAEQQAREVLRIDPKQADAVKDFLRQIGRSL